MRAACSTRWERVNTTLLPERQWKLPDICSFELKLSESETEKVGDKCTPADLLAASNARPPHCRYSHVWCLIHVPWVYTAFHLFIWTVENILALEPFYWPFIIVIYNIFIFQWVFEAEGQVYYSSTFCTCTQCHLSALLLCCTSVAPVFKLQQLTYSFINNLLVVFFLMFVFSPFIYAFYHFIIQLPASLQLMRRKSFKNKERSHCHQLIQSWSANFGQQSQCLPYVEHISISTYIQYLFSEMANACLLMSSI